VKQTFAVKPRGHAARVRHARPLLAPAPSPAPFSQAPDARARRSPLEAGGEGLSFAGKTNRKAAP
jgi:hypothetical protein